MVEEYNNGALAEAINVLDTEKAKLEEKLQSTLRDFVKYYAEW